MIIKFARQTNFLRTLLIETVVEWEKQGNKFDDLFKDNEPLGRNLDIVLTINGKEMPVQTIFDILEKEYDEQVRDEASRIIEERLAEAEDSLHEAIEDTKEQLQEIIKKFKNGMS